MAIAEPLNHQFCKFILEYIHNLDISILFIAVSLDLYYYVLSIQTSQQTLYSSCQFYYPSVNEYVYAYTYVSVIKSPSKREMSHTNVTPNISNREWAMGTVIRVSRLCYYLFTVVRCTEMFHVYRYAVMQHGRRQWERRSGVPARPIHAPSAHGTYVMSVLVPQGRLFISSLNNIHVHFLFGLIYCRHFEP